jgi:arylsulfatase A-like enzyme
MIMTMKTRMMSVVLGSLLALIASARAAERPPNFLFILGDNLGKDWFGCFGSQEQCTPHIDKLAAGGVRFPHCYMTALCSTSRAALLTGRYAFRTGWHTHHDAAIYGGGGFDWQRETTFARVLKSAGYATAIAGKWQINDLYEQPDALKQHGFDEHLVWTGALEGEGNADARWRASLAAGRELESRYWDPVVFKNGQRLEMPGRFGPDVYLEHLLDFIERQRDRPFLAYYATPLTHVPVVTTPASPQKDASEREQFAGMVRYLDQQVGRLVSELERLGLRERTIIVFTTDNGSPRRLGGSVGGELVPGGLGTQSEPGIDVPLIVNCPGHVPQGRVSNALVDCTDFFPTLLEFAGAQPPSGVMLDGRSFAAQIRGSGDGPPAREWIFAQYATTRIVRDQRYKLYSSGEIYDLAADWLEKTNLAESTAPEIVAARRRLQGVLDQLPSDAQLPFAPRSQSAFKLRGEQPKQPQD